jgi:hypothetical protein
MYKIQEKPKYLIVSSCSWYKMRYRFFMGILEDGVAPALNSGVGVACDLGV